MEVKFDPALNEMTSGIYGRTAYDPLLGSLVSGGGIGDFFYDPVSGLVRKSFGQSGPSPMPNSEGLVAAFMFDGSMDNSASPEYGGTAGGSGLEFRVSPSTRYSQHLRYAGGGYVSVPADPSMNFGTGDFTVSMWLRPNGTNECPVSRMSNGDAGDPVSGWCVTIGTGAGGPNSIEFNTWDSGGSSSTYWTPNFGVPGVTANKAMAYYVFERQGSVMRIYRNGVKVSETSGLAVRNVNTNRGMEFGRYNWAPGSNPVYFTGNMMAFRAFDRVMSESDRNAWYDYENSGFKEGGIHRVCWHDDANLNAYWPLSDGNLVDVRGGKTMQLFGASVIPGKGVFSGSPTDFTTPGYVNSTAYANCPTELGINGAGNVMVSVIAKIYPSQNPAILLLERSSSVNVSNGIRIDGGGSATGFRLRDYIQWQLGKTIGVPTASTGTVDDGVWVHLCMRQVWGQWMETFVNFNSGGGNQQGNTASGNPDGYRNGVTLFGRFYDPSPYSGLLGLVEAGTALVKDVSFWNWYQPAEDGDWVDRMISAYPEVYNP